MYTEKLESTQESIRRLERRLESRLTELKVRTQVQLLATNNLWDDYRRDNKIGYKI